jgi:hypothetical protein
MAPITFSLVIPPPLRCVSKYTRLKGRKLRTDKKPAAKTLYRSIFLDNDIWHYILSVLIFLRFFPIESGGGGRGGTYLLFLVDVIDLGVRGLIVERQLVASRELLERGMTLRSFHPVFRIDILKRAKEEIRSSGSVTDPDPDPQDPYVLGLLDPAPDPFLINKKQ